MGRRIRQWIAATTCNLSVAMVGNCFAWTAPILTLLISPESPVPMTSSEMSWLSGTIEIGAMVGTIPTGLLADRWGRKPLTLMAAPLCFIGWMLTIYTRSIYMLFLARFLHGLADAIAFTAAPMYLAEVAEPRIRGTLTGQFQAMWFAGCLYAYITGPYLSYDNYSYACAIIPILSVIAFLLVPESPYFLLMVNKESEALKALTWLRASSNVEEEFNSIKESVAEDMKQKGNWKDLFATKKDTKSFVIVQIVCIVKSLIGMTTINIYITQTFELQFGHILSAHELTIILSVILVLTTFFGSFLTDRIGRKPLLLFSCGGSAVCHFIISVIYYLDSKTAVDVSSIKWISYVALICFCVISNIGLGPLMQTIQAEYFPSHTRGIGGGITGVICAVAVFASIKQYQIVADSIGDYMNYIIFFVIAFFATILLAKVIPETARKSLGQIQKDFGNN